MKMAYCQRCENISSGMFFESRCIGVYIHTPRDTPTLRVTMCRSDTESPSMPALFSGRCLVVSYQDCCKMSRLTIAAHYELSSLPSLIQNKKAVLSQRWSRHARYISRSWAVAEIWPLEIIQDGGGRYLEIIRIENSAIRSAVPENPTLEPNTKWIRSPVADIWPFAYGGGI